MQMRENFNQAVNNDSELSSMKRKLNQIPSLDEIKGAGKVITARKGKTDYRLYPLYLSVKTLEKQCETIVCEFFKFNDTTKLWEDTEVHNLVAKSSEEAKETLTQMRALWVESVGQIDKLKAAWIKDKIIQTRYSKRGAAYVEKISALGDDLFVLSSLCISITMTLDQLIKDDQNVLALADKVMEARDNNSNQEESK